MGEWILMIWVLNCGGWHCEMQNHREVTGYETKSDCEESLQMWAGEVSASLTKQGVCIKIPASD